MTKLFPISELDVRGILLVAVILAFIRENWGSSFRGLKHVILSTEAKMLETLPHDLQLEIWSTVTPFGESVAHLLGFGLLWLFLDWVVRKLDLDKNSIENETILLRKENAYLRKYLKDASLEFSKLIDVIDSLTVRLAEIEKYRDQIAELNLELDKAAHKKEQAKKELTEKKKTDSPDLFDTARPKSKAKKRRPPRHQKPKPKF